MVFCLSYICVVQQNIVKNELVIVLLTVVVASIITTIATIPIRVHMRFAIVTVLINEDQIFSKANIILFTMISPFGSITYIAFVQPEREIFLFT